MDKDIAVLLEKIKRFRDERDWKQFHNHKDMAISIMLEAAELLEHFQWKNNEEIEKAARDNREEIGEEMADILLYLLELSDNMGIDLTDAAWKKMKKNEARYPVSKAKGTAKKYTEF